MTEKETKTALPTLRFPEFEGAGEWNVERLGNVAKLITEKAGSSRYKMLSITSGLGLVSQMEKFGREIAGESYKNYYVIRRGDFAYNKSSTKLDPEGQIAVLETEDAGAVPNSIFTCFRVDEQVVSPSFLKYPFANNIHGKWLRKFIAVGARANGALAVDSKDLLTLPLALPSLAEQQKVAATLSSLDELIAAESEKLEALQTHKRGLMQGLFPAEGETVPRLRFAEFEGEWVEVSLETISQNIMVGIASAATHAYRKSGVILFRNQNIKEGRLDDSDILFLDEGYEKAHRNKRLKAGDLLIARTGYPGTACVVPANYEGSQSFTTLIARPNSKLIDSAFLCFYINSESGQAFFESTKIGGGQQNVNAGSLSKMPIPYPSLEEQRKIAATLSSLDELIAAESETLDALKLHKKGLMQGLFPT